MRTGTRTVGNRAARQHRLTEIHLGSRTGEGYLLLTVVLMAFGLVIMSVALNGLALAVTYRRAVGLANVGAQAGAGSLDVFDGTVVRLNGNACSISLETVQASLPVGVSPLDVKTDCQQSATEVIVSVALKPLRVFGGVFPSGIAFVEATAKATPKYGINSQEN